MTTRFGLGVLGLCMVSGCVESTTETTTTPDPAPAVSSETTTEATASVTTPATTPEKTADAPATSAAAGDSVALTEANTKIEFVGIHSGDKPDPRKGSFGKLTGTATLEAGALKSVTVEIDTTSLATEIDKLTDHLKAPDFFDVAEHPTAKFESTAIEPGTDGKVNITGNLTLLGTTKPVTFPATVSSDGGLKLSAEFSIDRTEFGMTYGEGKVEKMVPMTVTIGG